MGSLGNCRVCGKDATVLYPLLAGSPSFCHSHHNSRDAGPFGCDFTGPDDFDIPIGDEEPCFREPMLIRRGFIWIDKEGNNHKLKDIDDYYLNNIINFLRRKIAGEVKNTLIFLEKEVERREKEKIK